MTLSGEVYVDDPINNKACCLTCEVVSFDAFVKAVRKLSPPFFYGVHSVINRSYNYDNGALLFKDGDVIGYVYRGLCKNGRFYATGTPHGVYIDPSERSRGFAKFLMKFYISQFGDGGARQFACATLVDKALHSLKHDDKFDVSVRDKRGLLHLFGDACHLATQARIEGLDCSYQYDHIVSYLKSMLDGMSDVGR